MTRLPFFFMLCLPGAIVLPISGWALEAKQDIQDVSIDSLLKMQVSTAAKYSQYASDAPASITIIAADDIMRYGYRTLDEVLMSVRGFYTSYDRHYEYLGVRGFGRPTDYNNRALLLLNGNTLNENFYGSAAIGTDLALDFSIVERIEIVRGPGSALYGTGAMFTVINIITKSGNELDGARISAEVGSYGERRGTVSLGKELSNGMDLTLSGTLAKTKGQDLYFKEYDAPNTNNGFAENMDWEKYHGLFGALRYKKFTIQGFESFREYGMPTAAWGMLFNDRAARASDLSDFVEAVFDSKIGIDKNIMLRVHLDQYRFEGTYPYEEGLQRDANNGKWLGGELQYRWDIRPENRITIGAEYQNHYDVDYRLWDENATYFNGSFPYHILSFYLQDEFQATETLSFTFGARRDNYSTVGSATTPRAAIIYNPCKTGTLKLLYGEAFRSPNVYEVYYEDVDIAKGNPLLKPEKIKTAELVWEQRLSDNIVGMAALYHYDMSDLIDPIIDPSDSLSQFRNVSQVRAKGVEMELRAHLPSGVRGYVNYIYQNAKDDLSAQKLTNSPSHIMKCGFVFPLGHDLRAAIEFYYETERETVYETKTDSYLLTNANVYTSRLLNHVRLSAKVRNVFNVAYATPGGYDYKQLSFPQNGRNYLLKLDYEF